MDVRERNKTVLVLSSDGMIDSHLENSKANNGNKKAIANKWDTK